MANQPEFEQSSQLTLEAFENLLEDARKSLVTRMRTAPFGKSANFERAVREVIQETLEKSGSAIRIDFNAHAQAFPDICIGRFGIEVKYTENDKWRGVANSISQGMWEESVTTIYVMWCKEGGREPDIMYRLYEDVVMHVRTSHVPRFEIDMETRQSLFQRFKTSYKEFSTFDMNEKMDLVRSYVNHRIRSGERRYFWFLESQVVDPRSERTLYLFKELELVRQLRLCIEEIILFSHALLEDTLRENIFDVRVRYFLNKHRIVYPQKLALYKAVVYPERLEKGESRIGDALVNDEFVADVFRNICMNSFRTHAEWWDGKELPNYQSWKELFRDRILAESN